MEYIRICGGGSLFIVAYNVLGGGVPGASVTPDAAVHGDAGLCDQHRGDLLLVEGFFTWARPAALATVAAQAVSVVVSLAVIQRRKDRLPFHFSRRSVR